MSTVSILLSMLVTLVMVIFIAPNVMAINRGKVLRNIAIWLAIMVGLALVYQTFGPGSQNPMFSYPSSMQPQPVDAEPPEEETNKDQSDQQGFMPPVE